MVLGITLGDAAGVGPEIVLRSYAEQKMPFPFVVIGDKAVLQQQARILGLHSIVFNGVKSAADRVPGAFNVIDRRQLSPDQYTLGKLSPAAGAAAYDYLIYAVRAALARDISAVVTLPMNKESTRHSIKNFTGHTDVIAELCDITDYTMTLITDKLVVPHVSAHVSLRQAIDMVTTQRVLRVIELTSDMLKRLKRSGKIAVLGLNPHAGEAGAFGHEDLTQIQPAVEMARERGIPVIGPLPADTAFMRGLRGDFAAIVCMYHDQGHAPMKTVGFDDGVNVTVGLPIIRTSVDHGTAFDIAGKGVARLESFLNACSLALQLAQSTENP